MSCSALTSFEGPHNQIPPFQDSGAEWKSIPCPQRPGVVGPATWGAAVEKGGFDPPNVRYTEEL